MQLYFRLQPEAHCLARGRGSQPPLTSTSFMGSSAEAAAASTRSSRAPDDAIRGFFLYETSDFATTASKTTCAFSLSSPKASSPLLACSAAGCRAGDGVVVRLLVKVFCVCALWCPQHRAAVCVPPHHKVCKVVPLGNDGPVALH